MRRSPLLLLLLLTMLWQSVALARSSLPVSPLGNAANAAHAALHWQQEAHHHHDDGSYQVDDSDESVQHVLDDPMNAPAALLTAFVHSDSPRGRTAAAALAPAALPDPAIEGLLRPPRPLS